MRLSVGDQLSSLSRSRGRSNKISRCLSCCDEKQESVKKEAIESKRKQRLRQWVLLGGQHFVRLTIDDMPPFIPPSTLHTDPLLHILSVSSSVLYLTFLFSSGQLIHRIFPSLSSLFNSSLFIIVYLDSFISVFLPFFLFFFVLFLSVFFTCLFRYCSHLCKRYP